MFYFQLYVLFSPLMFKTIVLKKSASENVFISLYLFQRGNEVGYQLRTYPQIQ